MLHKILIYSRLISLAITVSLVGTNATAKTSTEIAGKNGSIATLIIGINNQSKELAPNSQNNSQIAEYYTRLASEKYKKQDYQGALADLNRAIQLKPSYGNAYYNRGILKLENLQDTQGALADFNHAIQLDANHADAYNNRGALKTRDLQDNQGALADFNRAIQLSPKDAMIYRNRATLKYEKLKDQVGGIADMKQSAMLSQQQGNTKGYQVAIAKLRQWQQIDRRI
jgi:tetratricopeptide (TPR) repeat protein